VGTAAASARSGRGRGAEDLAVARWFETYQVTSHVPELPGLSAPSMTRLADLLRGDDVQAAVQELLAVRLTDGPNADAARARQAIVLTVAAGGAAADPEISGFAEMLAGYYDDSICELVGRLGESPLLAEVRSEALSARMIAVLHAIERHTAALSSRPALRTEADFLTRYRAHVLDQHGKLEPPDFERRRRVPIADIYVPTMIYEEIYPERTVATVPAEPDSLTVWDMAGRLDRSVLLGDPGGGKTTASTVLMHYFASEAVRRVPFLVTLRNFAAEDPPARSVVGHIEHVLETLYQCPAPPGLMDLLLLTGRAVVLFDGLDELLDTSRRADVATRVEQFCIEYPLAAVLVTSRVVGYDHARLDERHFTSYRLGGFQDEDVAEYAHKWFALEDGARPDDADAFLTESESVPDLRANPLLLSLMCILYRGEGSLPRNRAEVYENCANLLFRKWDARRRIHQDLRAGHLVEPALRHLAWWLFTRDDSQTAVTERELVAATTQFLHGRGFESLDTAREAAREFVEFCRGRMWVFSDTGTTATGEPLYTFTHRTFLEYFAAAQLAYDSDTPEKLARTLAPRVASGEWEIVAELAVQIKDSTSTDGAKRVYAELLNERRRRSARGRSNILQFLARTLRSVDPSPQVTRRISREAVAFLFSGDPNSEVSGLPTAWLLASCGTHLKIIDEEITASIAEMIGSDDPETHLNGLRLALSLHVPIAGSWGGRGPDLSPNHRLRRFWHVRVTENARSYAEAIVAAATHHTGMRKNAIMHNLITVEQALEMNGGLTPLLQVQPMQVFNVKWSPCLDVYNVLVDPCVDPQEVASLTAVGRYLTSHPQLPWITGKPSPWSGLAWNAISDLPAPQAVDEFAYLGGAAILLISAESGSSEISDLRANASRLGPFIQLNSYMTRRFMQMKGRTLPCLPVPEAFKQVFQDWAERKINFIGTTPDSADADVQQP
jgi:hypothetical protein